MMPTVASDQDMPVLDDIDAGRVRIYALLAALLWRAPDAALLAGLARPPAPEGEIGAALAALAEQAASTSPADAEREHFNLFTGVGGGEMLPYASYYLTGFLHERPLADLRDDLRALRLLRAEHLAEPEDHIAFVCEVMAGLIGRDAAPDDAAFFARHLQPWARGFFKDLETHPSARFYRPVGRLGRVVMEIEAAAFALEH